MEDFFKYLTPGEEDKKWGFFINVIGKANVPAQRNYPNCDHPAGYYFTWESGRVLEEFQIHYITHGSGIYENNNGKYHVRPGTLIITKPGVWHRFRPNKSTGWNENYVGFDGFIPREIFKLNFFSLKKPVKHVGYSEEILDTFYNIFEYVIEEKPGYQQIAAGITMKLLGYIASIQKQRGFSNKRIEKIIQKTRFILRENIEKDIDLKRIAEDNNIGYSYFRKMFREYTGIPPFQYFIDLKIMRAKELLLTSDKIVKEIGYQLGFQSVHYFSRLFKNKTGISPSEFRKRSRQRRNSSG